MRRLLLALIALGACAPRSPGRVPAERCEVRAPPGASRFETASVEELAGDFEIVTMDTTVTASPSVKRRVHLYVTDSLRRYPPRRIGYEPGARHLGGWVISDATDPWTMMLRSQDPDHPGVIWLGNGLRIGTYDAVDGGGVDLRPTWYSQHGFGGPWTSDLGIEVMIDSLGNRLPNPAGYFCARRLGTPPTRMTS